MPEIITRDTDFSCLFLKKAQVGVSDEAGATRDDMDYNILSY